MFARVNVLEGPPEQLDEHIRHVREQTLPQFQRQDGFKGLLASVIARPVRYWV